MTKSNIIAFPGPRDSGPAEAHAAFLGTDCITEASRLALFSLLLPAERERLALYRDREVQTRIAASDVLSRTLLADVIGGTPGEWQVGHDERGVPQARHPGIRTPVHLSRSRTRGLVAVSLSTVLPTGIDVEYSEPHPSDRNLAAAFFSAAERSYVESLPEALGNDAFFRTWTLKEAYIKARGLGFDMPLQSFTLISDGNLTGFVAPGDDRNDQWRFASIMPTASHYLAFGIRTRDARVLYREAVFNPEAGALSFRSAA